MIVTFYGGVAMGHTKVSIIDVDLGATVASIISEDILLITSANRDNIDTAVNTAKAVQDAVTRHQDKLKAKDVILDKLYDTLVTAYTNRSYVSSKEIIAIGGDEIQNMISFAGRMRTYLKAKGNEYRLISCKRNRETAYIIEPFNLAPETPVETDIIDPFSADA